MIHLYKTTIVSFKDREVVQAIPPDFNHAWEVFSISLKKKKIFYHWRTLDHQKKINFFSCEDDFQKSLEIVRQSKDNLSTIEGENNVDDK